MLYYKPTPSLRAELHRLQGLYNIICTRVKHQYIKLDRCEFVCDCLSVCHGCDVTSATCTLGTRL